MSYKGKVALITGGASGMGRVMALRLAQGGAAVGVIDMNRQALDEIAALQPGIRAYACDVTDPAAIQALVARFEQEAGPIDRLACSAGIMPALRVADMPVEKFAQVMRVNYEGTVNTVKAVLPSMQQRRSGEIILFGSLAGVVYIQGFGAYCASKAAVNAFGEVLAQELAGSGIRVMNVRPAGVKTPLIHQAVGEGGLKSLRQQADSGKLASPEAIIDAIESAIGQGKSVLYPTGDAWFGQLLRRFSPALTWRLINAVGR